MLNTVYAKPKTGEVRAAIYCRLSKDDASDGPSASIQNQRELLTPRLRRTGLDRHRDF